MKTTVWLDGDLVDADTVSPRYHRFLGMFRPADIPDAHGADSVLCPCGTIIWTVSGIRDHYRLGHFDTPQYVTIR